MLKKTSYPTLAALAIMLLATGTAISEAATQLAHAEYFLDADPGRGAATAIPIGDDGALDTRLSIATDDLAPGFHTLVIRAQDAAKNWGVRREQTFFIGAISAKKELAAIEFVIDQDTGIGQGLRHSVEQGLNLDSLFSTNLMEFSLGDHVLLARPLDANGTWGVAMQAAFSITETSPADFNRDGSVDFADFFLFADQFGTNADSPQWDARFDLAANTAIDFADFFRFADAFGQ